MRYYSLTISDPDTGASIVPDAKGGFTRGTGPTFTSIYKNPFTGALATDPGALNIDFDFIAYRLATFQGASRIKIWGVGLKMIGQANNLAGMSFSFKAGMAPGLPFANPVQAGLIMQGTVFEGFGNWQGPNQTLDLVLNPGVPGTVQSAFGLPVPFFWPAGSSLDDAIDTAITATFGTNFKRQIFIDANLRLANDEAGYYKNFPQFASYLKGITLKLGSQYIKNYQGVDMVWNGDTLTVFDGTGPVSVNKTLAFQDLVGQPTWIGGAEVSFKTVLRSDISVGNLITFPSGIVPPYALTSPAAAVPNAPASSKTVFQGSFKVNEVHHFGSYRSPDADSWATAFKAASPPVGSQ